MRCSAAFRARVLLLHHELGETEDIDSAVSVGILITPRRDGRRAWDTTAFTIVGDAGWTQADVEQYRGSWSDDRGIDT